MEMIISIVKKINLRRDIEQFKESQNKIHVKYPEIYHGWYKIIKLTKTSVLRNKLIICYKIMPRITHSNRMYKKINLLLIAAKSNTFLKTILYCWEIIVLIIQ